MACPIPATKTFFDVGELNHTFALNQCPHQKTVGSTRQPETEQAGLIAGSRGLLAKRSSST